jgi:multiple sugar transport system substrate-binding protein
VLDKSDIAGSEPECPPRSPIRPPTAGRAGRRRSVASAVAATVAASTVLAACGGGSGSGATPTLTWYVNPNTTGTYDTIAKACAQQSGGKYRISLAVLPTTADGQREQIVRRLAAKDATMDLMNVDPPYTTELANAGWLRPFTNAERTEVLKDVLKAPILSAEWKGQLVAVPWQANTQLLWYRKSVAQKAGVDPKSPTFTWDQMIDAAVKTGTTIEEQGKKYEGYTVWVNAMILGAGGNVLTNNDRARDATVAINSPAGKRAVEVIRKLAKSTAADPALSTADEEIGRAAFETGKGGFLLNWPYVYAAMLGDVKAGTFKKSYFDDLATARYPRVDANRPSKPPTGGVNLAVSKFSKHPDLAVEAVKCIVSPAMEKVHFLGNGDPIANATLYDDPAIRKKFPMADLIRQGINEGGPRPITPFYGDVSGAIQRDWHPASGVNASVPGKSATLIGDVLHDRRML